MSEAKFHRGMPPLKSGAKTMSFFEFWPMWLFYPPVFVYTVWLMIRYRGVLLPTVANPTFPGGGYYGESKSEILALARQHIAPWIAPFTLIDRPLLNSGDDADEFAAIKRQLETASLNFPLVAKPDLGCRGAGVKVMSNDAQLQAYLAHFPGHARFLLQTLIAHEGEAGVFYCRRPHERRGRIVSLTLKYFPHVVGDGRRTLRDLILADPRASRVPHLYLQRNAARLDDVPAAGEAVRLAFAGSHSRGAIFKDGTALVTPAMEARFESLARALPEFHFGRFDIRFENFADLQAGRDFTILEINGAGAETTHIWDSDTSLLQAWRDLMRQYRWLYEIGAANRRRGHQTMTFSAFRRASLREHQLTPQYPPTD